MLVKLSSLSLIVVIKRMKMLKGTFAPTLHSMKKVTIKLKFI